MKSISAWQLRPALRAHPGAKAVRASRRLHVGALPASSPAPGTSSQRRSLRFRIVRLRCISSRGRSRSPPSSRSSNQHPFAAAVSKAAMLGSPRSSRLTWAVRRRAHCTAQARSLLRRSSMRPAQLVVVDAGEPARDGSTERAGSGASAHCRRLHDDVDWPISRLATCRSLNRLWRFSSSSVPDRPDS